MDTSRRALGRLAVVVAATAALGQAGALAQSPDEKAILANLEIFRDGFLNQKLDQLALLVTDNVSYGHSSGTIETKQQFLDAVKNRKGKMTSLKFSDIKIEMSGASAIARHVWESTSEVDGKATNTKVGVMQVWQKAGDGKWRIYARQAFRLPS